MARTNTSMTIRFMDASKEGEGEAPIEIALDSESNLDDEGNTKTSFNIPDTAYFLVFSEVDYEIFKSAGTTKLKATDVPTEIVERITFTLTKEATLRYEPIGLTYEWIGNTPSGSLTFNGRKVVMSKDAVGVLECTYKTYADRWSLKYTESSDDPNGVDVVIVGLNDDKSKASITINFTDEDAIEDEEGEGGPTSYQLLVRDVCSDEVIEGVTVKLDGNVIGTTNSEGYISLGVLESGKRYALHMEKVGYFTSSADLLRNDGFTTP